MANSQEPAPDTASQADVEITDEALREAEEQVRQARAALEQAESSYQEACRRAREQVERLKETTAGDLIEGTLSFVRKHPGLGLVAAASLGFFFGRLFRR